MIHVSNQSDPGNEATNQIDLRAREVLPDYLYRNASTNYTSAQQSRIRRTSTSFNSTTGRLLVGLPVCKILEFNATV